MIDLYHKHLPLFRVGDFTFLWPKSRGRLTKQIKRIALGRSTSGISRCPCDPSSSLRSGCPFMLQVGTEIRLRHENSSSAPYVVGRGQINSCYGGRLWSVSIRSQDSSPARLLSPYEPDSVRLKSPWKPSSDTSRGVFSIAEISADLLELIFPGDRADFQGLVVVAGSTNSGKSLVARGVAHEYLMASGRCSNPAVFRRRRPHLVTFEDPIEKYFIEPGRHFFEPVQKSGNSDALRARFDTELAVCQDINGRHIDYTPQDKEADGVSLAGAVHAAKRQSPKVFFVGETRDVDDWRELVDFAGTGHLIVTTAHASSLVEAVDQIFSACGARTPAQRGAIAQRLLGIVHQRSIEVGAHKTFAPALWRRTPHSISSIIGHGLSSILPGSSAASGIRASCLGRTWFMRNLGLLRRPALDPGIRAQLVSEALRLDLAGA